MDFINLLILLLVLLIEEIDTVFLQGTNKKDVQIDHILFNGEEPSLLQCAQRCKYIDKDSAIDFKDSKCRCIRYKSDGQNGKGTLTKIFIDKKTLELIPTTQTPPKIVNLALGKEATQSSTLRDETRFSPSSAVDGKIYTGAVTKDESTPWWEVDMGNVKEIKEIRLTAVVGSSENKGLMVESRTETTASWKSCKNIEDIKNRVTKFQCLDKTTNARFVRIRSTKECYLAFYEVEIFGI